MPGDDTDAEAAEEAEHVVRPHHGGDLRHELVGPKAYRARELFALAHARLERPGVRLRLVEAAKGGEVHVGLVDARLLEGVHPVREEGHDARGRLAVRLPVVADEHRLRLPAAARRLGQAPGARDRQRRADAVLPRRVGGRGHDAAALPALGIGPHHHRRPRSAGFRRSSMEA